MQQDTLTVGAAEADITPSWPMHLVGMGRDFVAHDGRTFDYSLRDEPATETHDPITLQATYLGAGPQAAIVLSVDLVYTAALDALREAVAQACGLSAQAVMYAATHNHNGPASSDRYAALLCERAVECATRAMARAVPATVDYAQGHFDRLIHDRAEPWGPVDGAIDVLRFRARDGGGTIAMWWNYGCHPCSLSWNFNLFSADYPGAIRRHVTQVTGESFPVTFLTGSTGNIQPIGMMRFSSPPQMYLGVPKGDMEMVERLGLCVAEAGLRALAQESRTLNTSDFSLACHSAALPVQLLHDEAGLRALRESLGEALAQSLDGASPETPVPADVSRLLGAWVDELLPQANDMTPTHAISSAILAIGDVAVLFTPLEVAWQIGGRIRERSPFTPTLISTTSLGYESYLTEAKFYQLPHEERPYEAHGLMAMAGYSYTAASPGVFEEAVVSALTTQRSRK